MGNVGFWKERRMGGRKTVSWFYWMDCLHIESNSVIGAQWYTRGLIFKTWCLHYPQCNMETIYELLLLLHAASSGAPKGLMQPVKTLTCVKLVELPFNRTFNVWTPHILSYVFAVYLYFLAVLRRTTAARDNNIKQQCERLALELLFLCLMRCFCARTCPKTTSSLFYILIIKCPRSSGFCVWGCEAMKMIYPSWQARISSCL